MEKDIVAALRSKLQFLRGRRGPNNDPFLFVDVTTLMYEAANKIERQDKEIERLRKIVRMVAASEYVHDDWGSTGLDMGIEVFDIAAFDAVRDEARSLIGG